MYYWNVMGKVFWPQEEIDTIEAQRKEGKDQGGKKQDKAHLGISNAHVTSLFTDRNNSVEDDISSLNKRETEASSGATVILGPMRKQERALGPGLAGSWQRIRREERGVTSSFLRKNH